MCDAAASHPSMHQLSVNISAVRAGRNTQHCLLLSSSSPLQHNAHVLLCRQARTVSVPGGRDWWRASRSLTFLTDFRVGTAVNAAEGISPTFIFTSLLFLLTVNAEYFSATFSVSLTYFVACFISALLSTTESVIASRWRWHCSGRKEEKPVLDGVHTNVSLLLSSLSFVD